MITDPPYYDNISYADLSDFFYVWLKRSIGFLFEEHFAGELTPKQREAVMATHRHGGDKPAARVFYEQEMAAAFAEAHRVLKPGATRDAEPRAARPVTGGDGTSLAASAVFLPLRDRIPVARVLDSAQRSSWAVQSGG